VTRDIVNRLRTNRECYAPCLFDEAADEIVRLEAALLKALHERDEAKDRNVRLLSQLQEYEVREL
jgi:hypothetical protein